MVEIKTDPKDKLIQNLLRQTETALEENNLSEAEQLLERALAIKTPPESLKSDIRQQLKSHADSIAAAAEPDWPTAHQTYAILDKLELKNEDTASWYNQLRLTQANFLLNRREISPGFEIFAALLNNSDVANNANGLKSQISQIVRINIAQRAAEHDWPLVRQIILAVQNLWPANDELHDWLETISTAMAAVDQAAEQARQERNILTQQLETLTQTAERNQKIIYALGGIITLGALFIAFLIFS